LAASIASPRLVLNQKVHTLAIGAGVIDPNICPSIASTQDVLRPNTNAIFNVIALWQSGEIKEQAQKSHPLPMRGSRIEQEGDHTTKVTFIRLEHSERTEAWSNRAGDDNIRLADSTRNPTDTTEEVSQFNIVIHRGASYRTDSTSRTTDRP
jgi:hypothetical protein